MALRPLVLFAASFVLAACMRTASPARPAASPLQQTAFNSLYVVTSDFKTGGVRKVDLLRGTLFPQIGYATADAVARFLPQIDRLVVINRAASFLGVLRPDLSGDPFEIALPENSNPQDICFLGGHQAYVALYQSRELKRMDLQTGKTIGEGINLSQWRDDDGSPESAHLLRVGDRVLLTLQRIDTSNGYVPVKPSYLLVLDPFTDTVVHQLELAKPNPFTRFKIFEDEFYLGEVGINYQGIKDGAIEKFDGKTFQSKGIVIDEATLGGDILDFEILTQDLGVAIVGTPKATGLVRFNPRAKKVIGTPLLAQGYRFSKVLVDRSRDLYYVTDLLQEDPAIRVFGYDGGELESNRIAMDLPPFDIVLGP